MWYVHQQKTPIIGVSKKVSYILSLFSFLATRCLSIFFFFSIVIYIYLYIHQCKYINIYFFCRVTTYVWGMLRQLVTIFSHSRQHDSLFYLQSWSTKNIRFLRNLPSHFFFKHMRFLPFKKVHINVNRKKLCFATHPRAKSKEFEKFAGRYLYSNYRLQIWKKKTCIHFLACTSEWIYSVRVRDNSRGLRRNPLIHARKCAHGNINVMLVEGCSSHSGEKCMSKNEYFFIEITNELAGPVTHGKSFTCIIPHV